MMLYIRARVAYLTAVFEDAITESLHRSDKLSLGAFIGPRHAAWKRFAAEVLRADLVSEADVLEPIVTNLRKLVRKRREVPFGPIIDRRREELELLRGGHVVVVETG